MSNEVKNFSGFFLKYFGYFLVLFLSNFILDVYYLYLVNNSANATGVLFDDIFNFIKNILITFGFLALLMYIAFKSGRFSKPFLILLVIVNLIFIIIDWFLVINFGAFINQFIIDAIFRTNTNEIKEFFNTYFNLWYIAFVLLVVVSYMMFLRFSIHKTISSKANAFFIVFVAIIILGTTHDMYRKYQKTKTISYTLARLESFCATRMLTAFMYYKENTYADYKSLLKNYALMHNTRKPVGSNNGVKNIVLIIGESLRQDALSLYGGGDFNKSKVVKIYNIAKFNII